MNDEWRRSGMQSQPQVVQLRRRETESEAYRMISIRAETGKVWETAIGHKRDVLG